MQVINANIYYVYRHTRLDINEVFYIGLGRYQKKWKYQRSKTHNDRNQYWKNIVAKCNNLFKIDIIYDGLTKEQAQKKEQRLIKLYGRSDLKLGTLCNLTDGGECNTNLSLESRQKLSNSKIGVNNPMYGKKQSPEVIAKRSIKLKGEGNPWYGKTFSDEYKLKLSKAKLGKKLSQETKDKMSKSRTGLKRTTEFCEKMKLYGIKQSSERRERALLQWVKKKSQGLNKLKNV